MKNIVSSLYAEYGRYIDSFRAIPKHIDCLKPVERRLLISVHQVARKKFQKSAKVVGTCIGNYHPHGDCILGSTQLYCLDTQNIITIEDTYNLKIEQLKVLGVDKDNKVIPVTAHSFRIGQYTDTLYHIKFEDGCITTTEDHQFNTINDGWVKAKDLTLFHRTVAIYTSNHKNTGNYIVEIPQLDSKIKSITIEKLDKQVPMYDFTVDEHENMFVIGGTQSPDEFDDGDGIYMRLVNIHNSSTYEALVGLVKRGFVEGQGNWGKNSYPKDDRAGAYRYTECKAVDSLNSIFEKYLDFVPWDNLELEKEPLYIPFPVPVGLIGSGLITGIGFHTTKIPRYNFIDLLRRLIELVENKTKTTIIPFVHDCDVTEDTTGDFEKILNSGEGKIRITPKVKIESHKITVYGKNPYTGFNNLSKFNENYEEQNNIPYCDVLDGTKYDSKTSVHLEITPSKGAFVSKTFSDKIISLLSSTETIRVNVIDDNNTVYQTGVDTLILNSYNKWKKSNLEYLRSDLEKVESKINEFKIILVIRDILGAHPELLKDKTIKDVVNYNTSNYRNNELIRVCNKHNIKTLIESHIDINSLITTQTDLKSKINNIDNYVLKTLKNKFGL